VYNTTAFPVPPEYEELVFRQHLTTTEIARRHLARFDLDRYANLVSGDFSSLDHTHNGFIFCDALHDPTEIALNLPSIISVSDADCVWAFHDMTQDNVSVVLQLASARLIRVVGTLGVFRFRRGY
jgi:hypothetical protein